jgi:hypothetical protein
VTPKLPADYASPESCEKRSTAASNPTRRGSNSERTLPPPVRLALDKLVAVGALAHQDGQYTCSLVTTYSTYTLYHAQLAPMLPGTALEQAPLDDRNGTRVR